MTSLERTGWGISLLTVMATLGGCDIPTDSPILEQEWLVPISATSIDVGEFLPDDVDLNEDSSAFTFQAELARVEVAFPSIGAIDPHAPALDLLSDILGAGYNSVLYTELKRRRDVAHDVYAYNYTPLDRGVFLVGASCTPDLAGEVAHR